MFEWEENFSVGVDKIDRQHQELLRIGGELVDAMKNISQGIDEYDHIRRLLQEMSEYTVEHFKSEEMLMAKHDFPGLESHQKQHQLFVGRLEDINLDNLDRNQEKFMMDLLDFIANWVENHILEVDSKYGDYFAQQGITD
ncbi:MAG: bacteriohemerythrin [Bacillota bacterium]